MANILFLMRYPMDGRDNLIAKFDGQMAAVRALGHETRFLAWNRVGIWLMGGEQPCLLKRTRLSFVPGYGHTLLYVALMAALRVAVRRERFALVYMRYMPTFSNAPGALRAAKETGARLIVEHPTYPFENGKTTSPLRKPVFRYMNRVFARVNPLIDLYTLVGDPNDGMLEGRPAMNILNGVDVSRFPLHQPRAGDGPLHLLALASMSRWQGYDRLLRAMAQSPSDTVVHLVGGEGDGALAEWKKLAEELHLGDRARFEGEMHGPALEELIARCDAGVGGLGLYRKGQYRSMTLKLREYMARGLPFVYAVDDPGVPQEPEFCLRIPNDNSLPDMNKIEAFARRARENGDAPRRMRAYAQAHLSWTSVLKPVLERVNLSCQEP